MPELLIRNAQDADIAAITRIYNQGIEDRIATLEADQKSESQVRRTPRAPLGAL